LSEGKEPPGLSFCIQVALNCLFDDPFLTKARNAPWSYWDHSSIFKFLHQNSGLAVFPELPYEYFEIPYGFFC
jgi:hypothetical protein